MSRNFHDSGSLARARDNNFKGPGAGRGDFNRGKSDGRSGDGRGGSFDRRGGDGRGGSFDRRGGDSHGGRFDGRGGSFAGRGGFDRHGYYGGFGRRGYSPWGGFYSGLFWGWGWGSPYWYYGGSPYWGGGYGGWGGYGYPYDYGYNGSYGYGGYPATTYLYADNTYDNPPAIDEQPAAADQAPADPTAEELERASQYISLGEQSFRAGSYQDALRQWRHAMVDNPNNGALVLLMSQALFALGEYDSAANSVQMAMQMLPESEWGGVVKNYTQLYPNIQVYTDQIRAAEKARDAEPDDGAIRFLLGYHFGYLNYPKQAVRELDKALDIEPRDAGAQKLRDIFARQASLPARPPAAVPESAPKAEEDKAPDKPAVQDPVPPAIPPAKPKAPDDAGIPAAAA